MHHHAQLCSRSTQCSTFVFTPWDNATASAGSRNLPLWSYGIYTHIVCHWSKHCYEAHDYNNNKMICQQNPKRHLLINISSMKACVPSHSECLHPADTAASAGCEFLTFMLKLLGWGLFCSVFDNGVISTQFILSGCRVASAGWINWTWFIVKAMSGEMRVFFSFLPWNMQHLEF